MLEILGTLLALACWTWLVYILGRAGFLEAAIEDLQRLFRRDTLD